MPDVNISFAGQTLVLPGAYYTDLLSGFVAAPPTTPPLIYIGYGYGVPPLTPYTFVDGQSLLNSIRGGPASGFVPFLVSPSPAVFGAQIITYINPGENTQAHLNLLQAAGSGVAVLTTTNYGLPSNLMQAQVAAGTQAGKKVTLYDGYAGTTVQGDNLGVPFKLSYTGAATGAVTFTISTSGLTATTLAVASPNTGESLTINLGPGQFNLVSDVINYLNGTGFYSAIAVGDGNLPATYLDSGQTAVPITSGGYTNVTAALGSVLYWANQFAAQSNYVTAAISGSITSYTSGLAPANIPFTSFTGATSVPPSSQDYANALNVALTIPGWAVFVDSDSAAVRSLGTQHAETASQAVNGKWRRFYTGSTLGDSISTTIANAQGANSKRTVYAYPGIYRTNPITGINTLYGGLYVAAAAAGMSTGNQTAMPLTNKVLTGNGVEIYLSATQINQLQQAGVMCIKGTVPPAPGVVNYNNQPPTIVSDLTTWQNDNNPENVFEQQIKCRDYLAYSLVNATQQYIGTIADVYDESRILNACKATLNALIYTPGSNGVLASWNANSLQLSYSGLTQTASVSASVQLVGQNRFITETVTIFPLNITINTSTIQPTA